MSSNEQIGTMKDHKHSLTLTYPGWGDRQSHPRRMVSTNGIHPSRQHITGVIADWIPEPLVPQLPTGFSGWDHEFASYLPLMWQLPLAWDFSHLWGRVTCFELGTFLALYHPFTWCSLKICFNLLSSISKHFSNFPSQLMFLVIGGCRNRNMNLNEQFISNLKSPK